MSWKCDPTYSPTLQDVDPFKHQDNGVQFEVLIEELLEESEQAEASHHHDGDEEQETGDPPRRVIRIGAGMPPEQLRPPIGTVY